VTKSKYVNFLTAMLIAYGFPLVALIAGIFGGYYGLLALGLNHSTAQALGAVSGLIALAASYVIIKYNEESIKKIRKFKPIIVGIKTKDSI